MAEMINRPKFKLPKTLGACADRLYEAREARLKLQKEADLLQAEETFIKEHLIQNLPKSEASGIAGKLVRVTIVTKQVPQVKDWTKLYAYIKKQGAFDLLQRRLTDTAIAARWEAGQAVPGVEPFGVVTISMNKV